MFFPFFSRNAFFSLVSSQRADKLRRRRCPWWFCRYSRALEKCRSTTKPRPDTWQTTKGAPSWSALSMLSSHWPNNSLQNTSRTSSLVWNKINTLTPESNLCKACSNELQKCRGCISCWRSRLQSSYHTAFSVRKFPESIFLSPVGPQYARKRESCSQ